jgi:2-polyprenyl-3-methyl-5-hydroxy-6-metoxy-1,4-benzoquinol methylase
MKKPKYHSWKLQLFDNSDASWRQYGRIDPYYGVLTVERFRNRNLNDAHLQEFFDSGEIHIDRILRTAAQHVSDAVATGDALDFGCGVGRLVVPLARRFRSVTGVDVSSEYISEAKRNCDKRDIQNVAFFENITAVRDSGRNFDFVHSCIVFNHIAWSRGQKIISEMFRLLRPGGLMAIQVLHYEEMGRLHRLARSARKFLPLHWLSNLISGRHVFEPLMQANEYPLDELVASLHALGADGLYIEPQTSRGREHWAFIICAKNAG